MSEERIKILEMLKEGKIDAEEAHELLEDVSELKEVCSPDGAKVKVKIHDKHAPRGFFGWVFKLIFGLLAFAIGAGVLFCLLYYLPFHLPAEKLLIIYGVIGIAVLAVTLIAVYAIGVGRLAVKKGIRSSKGDVVGGDYAEKPKTEETKQ
jgi:hypothetical protein